MDGYTGDTVCSSCGGVLTAGTVIPRTREHDLDVGTIQQASTCTTPGIKRFTCKICYAKVYESLPLDPNNHYDTEVKDTVTATCVQKGYTGDTYCQECGTLLEKGSETDVDLTRHVGSTYIANAKDPTCVNNGYTGDTMCSSCNNVVTAGEEIAATGAHDWVDQGIVLPATCSAQGTRRYICSVCKNRHEENVPIDPNYHALYMTKLENVVTATCVSKGYTGDTCCGRCGTVLEKGSETAIDASNHVNTHTENAKAAACGVDGYSGDTVCDDCGKTVASGSVVPMTRAHSLDAGTTQQASTCTTPGKKRYTCTNCYATVLETLPLDPNNHYFTEVRNDADPTCVAGYSGDTYCKECGKLLEKGQTLSPVQNHNWKFIYIQPAEDGTDVDVYQC